jgi:HK97 family phage portal protein
VTRLPARREARSADTLTGKLHLLIGDSSGAGVPVNEFSASGVSAVSACVKILANMVSVLPLKLMRSTASGSEVVVNHPAARVIRQPSDLHTGGELRALMETGKGFGGNGYARVHRVGKGDPVELEWLPPCDVEPYRPSGTRMIAYRINGRREHLTRYDVIHIRGMSLDGVSGISPIRQLRNSIGTSIAQSEAAGRLMRNGTTFPGYMTSPDAMSKDQIEDARREWDEKHSGAANSGRVPIMWGGWEFKQTNGMSMVDAQFLESRRFELEEIARAYGIPSFMINDTTKTTSWGSGMQEIIETWLKVSLDGLLVHWEESVGYTLLTSDEIAAGFHFKFNRRKLLEQTPEKQAAFLTAMRSIGAYSVNDVRRKVDENDLADPEIGDNYALPFNNTGGAAKAAQETPPVEPSNEPQP